MTSVTTRLVTGLLELTAQLNGPVQSSYPVSNADISRKIGYVYSCALCICISIKTVAKSFKFCVSCSGLYNKFYLFLIQLNRRWYQMLNHIE